MSCEELEYAGTILMAVERWRTGKEPMLASFTHYQHENGEH